MMMLWSNLATGANLADGADAPRWHGEAALDRLVDLVPTSGLSEALDVIAAVDVVVTGPYQARAGAIPKLDTTLELIVDPRNASGGRTVETRADLARWTEFVR